MAGAATTGGADVGQIVTEQLMAAAQVVEEQLDEQIRKMDKMDEDDLEDMRKKRLAAMKRQEAKKKEWLTHGHGQYEEIPEEKEFFNATRNSDRCVVHFYRSETPRCRIFDMHLKILASKHLETKFCKIDAEKCPFLTDRLKVRVIPTLVLTKDAKTRDFVVGFSDLGNTDEFSTEMLEWRLAKSEVIHYSGDLMTPPDKRGGGNKTRIIKGTKTIKGKDENEGSSDDDW